MKLQEKEEQKDKKNIGKLFRNNPEKKSDIVRAPLYKGGIDFHKFGNKGGDGILFLEKEGFL